MHDGNDYTSNAPMCAACGEMMNEKHGVVGRCPVCGGKKAVYGGCLDDGRGSMAALAIVVVGALAFAVGFLLRGCV